MKSKILLILLSVMCAACTPTSKVSDIDLSGEWTVLLDSAIVGSNNLSTISLPGTTDLAGIGVPNTLTPALQKPQVLRLTRKNAYVGVAEYTRQITVPEEMANQPLRLTLERVLWKSQVLIDGDTLEGFQESLTTPHIYVIEDGFAPGTHEVKLIIDNTLQHEISVDNLAHAYTNDTQVMWNGVLGEMSLTSIPQVEVESVQAYPDISDHSVTVRSEVHNRMGTDVKGSFSYTIDNKNVYKMDAVVSPGVNVVTTTIKLPDYVKGWSEFSPNIYEIGVTCTIEVSASTAEVPFGLREISTEDKVVKINDTPVFLRGTLECCIFPLTGTPPTDKAGWQKVFGTARQWGLNHLLL